MAADINGHHGGRQAMDETGRRSATTVDGRRPIFGEIEIFAGDWMRRHREEAPTPVRIVAVVDDASDRRGTTDLDKSTIAVPTLQ
jgi:hypothetical protein